MHVGDIRVGMFPAIAIVGGNVPIAAGAALAAKRLGDGPGDGLLLRRRRQPTRARSTRAMNMAAIWDLPVVYVCENNLYAASTPVSTAFKIANVADRAAAYGMPGVVVDGNDVEAVYAAGRRRPSPAPGSGEGPTLDRVPRPIACAATRAATRAPTAPRRRRQSGQQRDPIPNLARAAQGSGAWSATSSWQPSSRRWQRTIDDAVALCRGEPVARAGRDAAARLLRPAREG